MFKSMYKFTTLSLSLLLLWCNLAGTGYATDSEHEQQNIEWSRLYGGNHSAGRTVTPTSDGGYVAVGDNHLAEGYVVKMDRNGFTEWEQEIDNDPYGVLELSDGSILISGTSTDETGRPTSVIHLTKLDANGSILWDKAYPEYSDSYYHYHGEKIVEAADGNLFITGHSSTYSEYAPAYLLKINPSGEEIWFRTLWLDENQRFKDITATPDGGIIAVGTINSGENPSVNAAITVKFTENGEIVWENIKKNDDAQRPSADAIHPTHNGGYIIIGRLNNSTSFIQKINDAGEVIFEKNFDAGTGTDYFNQIQSVDNGYALMGWKYIGSYPSLTTKYQIIVADEDGEIKKTDLFGDSDLYSVGKGIATTDGGFLLAGTLKRGTNYHFQLVKIAGNDGQPTEPELTRIEFSPHQFNLSVGQSVNSVVHAIYSHASVTDVTYSAVYESLDPSIATVDSFGQITGVHPGSTIVSATYGGLQTTATIQVTGEGAFPGHFYLDSDEYSLSIGTKLDVAAFYTDELGSTSIVTKDTAFSSAHPEIATIDEDGNITGIAPGIAHITATYNGLTYQVSVWVVRPYVPPAP